MSAVHCPITQQACVRNCPLPTECRLHKLKQGAHLDDRRHLTDRRQVITQHSYFIPMHKLGTLEFATKSMLTRTNKRARRIDFNAIQQVLKTLQLIPHSEKVISMGLGLLDNGELGMLVLCGSPHQVFGDVPTSGNYAAERERE